VRFHRLVRRGRAYGSTLSLDSALEAGPDEERGILFVALCADLVRQFEFVQEAWLYGPKFDGLGSERDPLTAARNPLSDETATDHFTIPKLTGVPDDLRGLPQFVTVRGGAYFFLPGIRALRFIAGA
jgi:deferrochelatase/peroxidase EfeB